MDPVQIEFPADWDESIHTRVAERGKASVADYVRDLVAADIMPNYVDEETERLLIDGLESSLEGPVDADFWTSLQNYAKTATSKAAAARQAKA